MIANSTAEAPALSEARLATVRLVGANTAKVPLAEWAFIGYSQTIPLADGRRAGRQRLKVGRGSTGLDDGLKF